VTVDQTREHGRPAQVDDSRVSGNRHAVGWTHIRNPIALDEHDLVFQVRARFGVKHPTGPNGEGLRSWRSLSPHQDRTR
jgi:hypothetical protein